MTFPKPISRLLLAALALTSTLALTSCEEVIDYKLDTTAEKLVIEGWVTDQPGPYYVKLSSTKGYLDQGATPRIDAELVTITDVDHGLTDTLRRAEAGLYLTTGKFTGQVGGHYRLLVRRGGQEYGASSELRRIAPIDSLSFEYKKEDEDVARPDSGWYSTLYFREPAGRGDYYQFNIYQNGTWRNHDEVSVIDDEFYDGNYGDPQIGYAFRAGDTITVEMRSITKPGFDFLNGLSLAQQNQGTPFDSPPANAPGNLSNGALGFFGAAGVRRMTAIVPGR